VTAFAIELMPRITRAQAMDVLSSSEQRSPATAPCCSRRSRLPKHVPDAGYGGGHAAARRACFVVGVGVAGLQALGTAKRLER
jgi:H+-translocating NAD(P) transhydrogenase subunit alpha